MKKIVCLLIMVAFSGAMMAQSGLKMQKVATPATELVDALDKKVNLTDTQKKNATKIYTRFIKEQESASVLSGEPKKMALKAAKDKTEKALQAILTDEQRKVFTEKEKKAKASF